MARLLDRHAGHLAQQDRARQPRLLELGCGTGGNLPLLARHGQAVGVDPSPLAVARARTAGVGEVHQGQLPDGLPPGIGRFDVICLLDVLEHVDDDGGAMRAVAGLLRPRGLVLVTVPALPWLWSRHDQAFGHRRRYVRRGLEALVARAGLELVHCSYFCSLLLPAIAVTRAASRWLGLRQGNDFEIPVGPANRLLHAVFAAEAGLVVDRALPLGSSLLAVARSPWRARSATTAEPAP